MQAITFSGHEKYKQNASNVLEDRNNYNAVVLFCLKYFWEGNKM